jgi:hypothetical protein
MLLHAHFVRLSGLPKASAGNAKLEVMELDRGFAG